MLTPDPPRRAGRALAAAQAKHQAGAFDPALRLVAIAEAGPLNELQRAQVQLLRGQIAFALNRGSVAAPLLLEAAKRLEPLDPALARETYAEALAAAMYAGRLAKSRRCFGGGGGATGGRVSAPFARDRSPPRWPGAADHRAPPGGDADVEART